MKRLSCGSPEHTVNRRQFLQGGIAATLATSLSQLAMPSFGWADELKQQQKRVLLLWLAGGASQLETFDPKPGRPTGGPFRAIPTAVPGTHICELMPKTAKLMNKIAVVRSLDTKIADHGQASDLMQRGRRQEAEVNYPDFGTVVAKELAPANCPVPEYVSFFLATEGQRSGRPNAGFLGGRYAAMTLEKALRPQNIDRPAGLTEQEHLEREQLRQFFSDRFNQGRADDAVQGHSNSYGRVHDLMKAEKLFNLDLEPATMRERYGKTDFGQHALIGRRLLEAGVPMVKVSRAWWDSHADNFESHRELVSELDHVYTTLLTDLEDRGLLESTLIVTLSEFGRTPSINANVGRDHFASAWSCSLAGCGIKGGTVHGKTDENGNTVADGKVGAAEMVATIYKALGINPKKNYKLGQRPIPLVQEHTEPIATVLG